MSATAAGPEELLEVAVRAARAAAVLIREQAREDVTVAATKSSEVDVVTRTDRESEALIRATIAAARPDDAVLGEEGDDVAGTTGVRWVVDPIDGTVNFLYGLPEYAVSVAAEVEGRVVAGIVLNVATGVEHVAHRTPDGVVARRRSGPQDDVGTPPAGVRGPTPLARRLLITGFGYDARMRERQAAALLHLLPRVRDIRRHGSCALELCHLAEGQADGYFEVGVHLWDYAAGALVAEGAGARVEELRGIDGRTLLVAAPEHGFEELREAVLAAGYGDVTDR